MAGHVSSFPSSDQSVQSGFFVGSLKAYANHFKGLGGSKPAGDNGLKAEQERWYREDFYPYYVKVMNGEVQVTDPAAWQDVLASAQWVLQQNPNFSQIGSVDFEAANFDAKEPQVNEFGGELGPDGVWTYDITKTRLGFTGKGSNNVVWGTDNVLSIDSPSAKINYELSLHGNPAVKSLKVTVTTSKGSATYWYDNWEKPGFKLKLEAPDTAAITGDASLTMVTKGKPSAAGKSGKEIALTDHEGEETEINGKPATRIEADSASDVININPQPHGDEGTKYIDSWGNTSVNVKPSDQVLVDEGCPGDPKGYTITVKHKDGSETVVYTHEGYQNILDATPAQIQWRVKNKPAPAKPASPIPATPTPGGGSKIIDILMPADTILDLMFGSYQKFDKVPAEYKKNFTIKGSGAKGGASGGVNSAAPGDTDYDKLSDDGKTAFYNSQTDVSLTTTFEEDVVTHQITAPGTVQISKSNYSDSVSITKNGGKYTIVVTSGEDPSKKVTYIVDGASAIELDFLPGKVKYLGSTYYPGIDPKIKVSGEEAAQGDLPPQLQALVSMGFSIEQILKAVEGSANSSLIPYRKADGDDSSWSLEDLKKAIKDGAFPYSDITATAWFLVNLDPTLKNHIESFNSANAGARVGIMPQLRDRLVELLNAVYGAGSASAAGSSGAEVDDIIFKGQKLDIINAQENGAGDAWRDGTGTEGTMSILQFTAA